MKSVSKRLSVFLCSVLVIGYAYWGYSNINLIEFEKQGKSETKTEDLSDKERKESAGRAALFFGVIALGAGLWIALDGMKGTSRYD